MMNDSLGPRQPATSEGLCPACANVQVITNDRGSRFFLCRLSASDKRYPKYPPQPVIACAGYTRRVNDLSRNPTS
jgi:hypothetical protein